MYYRLKLTPDDNGAFLVTSPDLPEVTTFAESEADAIPIGTMAVTEALAARLARWEATALPDAPTDKGRRLVVRTPTLLAAKISLMNACIAQGVTRAELARRLGWAREQVDRIFRADHASRFDQIEFAAGAVGMEFALKLTGSLTGRAPIPA